MHTEAQVLAAFESMRQVLRPAGILVLTQGTTDKQWQEKPRFVLAVNERDVSRLFVIDYMGEGARYHLLDIFHTEEVRELKEWSVEYPRIYLRDDQVRMLKASGFKIIDCYGSWGFDPYDPNASDRLVVVAQK
jgi:SAM-dependent methyltransferase